MTFSEKQIAELSAPFPPDLVSWRVGSMTKDKAKGMALAYIDARDVMARLDAVCGPANWQCRYTHADGKTICEIGIRIDGEWVWKANGAGDTDIEAEKGAISDAYKRAAVMWGIGRYLYDVASPWVEVDQYKAIKPHEMKRLEKLLTNSAPPARNAGARDALPPVDRAPANNEPPSDALQTALTAIAMALDSPSLSDWWKAHKNGLKSVLSDAEYLKAFDAAVAKIRDLKAMEDNPQADERNAA